MHKALNAENYIIDETDKDKVTLINFGQARIVGKNVWGNDKTRRDRDGKNEPTLFIEGDTVVERIH